MQLVAYGAQDVYLTGNPQITYFKNVHRRHTNFSMESIEQTFNGTADFGKRISATISRNGDLIHKMYVQVELPTPTSTDAWSKHAGHALLKSVEIEIGGQTIDKHYGEWMQIWHELTYKAEHEEGITAMLGTTGTKKQTLYVPLQFWFCKNAGLALPLIALQYHDVKINIELSEYKDCLVGSASNTSTAKLGDCTLWVDYIYLDTDERRRFAQSSHEYLIEQVQFTGISSVKGGDNHTERLNFNHPVKELIWAVRPSNVTSNTFSKNLIFTGDSSDTTNNEGTINPIETAKLLLNGHERFKERNGAYFNLVQPYQCHTRIPEGKGVNCYSFALKPEDHQPSGTCNMSRIDNAQLQLKSNETGDLFVFAVNYNVLRIVSGMGGLAFSN